MPSSLDRKKVRGYLEDFDLHSLFINMLGWDHGGANIEVTVADKIFILEAIAHKRGLVAYRYTAGSDDAFPDHPIRRKIEKAVAKTVREHIIIYATHDEHSQYWQWVKREQGRPERLHQHIYHQGQSGEALIQKLEQLVFTLDEEDDLTIVDVSGRVRAAFDVEKVTKRFYERFKKDHHIFLGFIDGIRNLADREWYASLMLNRMMFIYFIQKQGFLDGDPEYLRNRLRRMQTSFGKDQFQTFYRLFLLRLFHEGLGQPESDRSAELSTLLGRVPYLNGGLFDVHDLERDNPKIHIPDEAFEHIFTFFDAYQWHLDDRPLHADNEINPDVLGYIFEKYVNQKQMGAYYTKEDITGYISRNTIIPFLFDQAKKDCSIAFKPGGGVWRLLSDDPDRYFYEAVRHGITWDINQGEALTERRELPLEIATGLNDVSQRSGWNKPASPDYALPTETWREHVARRQRYEEVHAKLAAGEVMSINDLITYNLDIEKFAHDVIAGSEGPELVRAFWKALDKISILDPTCGSGAFLFAALNILEPLYTTCLETICGFLEDLERLKRKHRPEKMSDFRKILRQIAEHASERYFILKSIIVNNLYGVDIMEEAVEICKLRLFLKLVAQLDSYDQIEPLPDVDFNIRAGNTLVGFASMDELKRAVAGDWISESSIPEIEERAEIADRAFRKFREMQIDQGMDANNFANAKLDLRSRLDNLRSELNLYLASEYGIKTDDQRAYEDWCNSHQPFHWFVEFYGIMSNGGFDVIIGNPPYLEAREVSYTTRYYACEDSGAIHAFCIERSLSLCAMGGSLSMIVPLALVSTQRMTILQDILEKNRDCWYSNYSWRPGKLFDTVNRALTIFVSTKSQDEGDTYTTGYLKWNADVRNHLLQAISFVKCPRNRNKFWAPKLGQHIESSILKQFQKIGKVLEEFTGKSSNLIYYRTTGGLYWKIFTDFPPLFSVNGVSSRSSRETNFALADKDHVPAIIAILSSDLFWWWYTISSNLRDLNPSDWRYFPISESAINDPEIRRLGSAYIDDLRANSTMLVRNQRSTGKTETQSFKVQKSKHIIDEIDNALASHYGLTDEELDFIINYDIKYRMGLSNQSGSKV